MLCVITELSFASLIPGCEEVTRAALVSSGVFSAWTIVCGSGSYGLLPASIALAAVLLGLGCEVVVELRIEPLAGNGGNLKSLPVSYKLHNIPCAIEDGTAMGTVSEVGLHNAAKLRAYLIVEIIGDLPPHFFAVNLNGYLSQGLTTPVLGSTL